MRGMSTVPDNADQYWQRPPARDKGDEHPDALWQAIGSSLTSWEILEGTLASMFSVFVESRSIAANRAYGAIASARGRIDALEAAAEVFFTLHKVADVWREEYKLLMRHFTSASGRRNEIAHGVSVYCQFEEDGSPTGIFLVPAGYNTRKTHAFAESLPIVDKFAPLKAKYRYTAEDVSEITSRFHVLNRAANEWTMNLWVAYPSSKYDKAE